MFGPAKKNLVAYAIAALVVPPVSVAQTTSVPNPFGPGNTQAGQAKAPANTANPAENATAPAQPLPSAHPARPKARPLQPRPPALTRGQSTWKNAAVPRGAKYLVMQGRLDRKGPITMRIRYPKHAVVPPHTLPTDETITVLRGEYYSGIGRTVDPRKAKRVTTGGLLVIPARTPHYAWTNSGALIQINAQGPWHVQFLNKKQKRAGHKRPHRTAAKSK